jgi:hypothetical protein
MNSGASPANDVNIHHNEVLKTIGTIVVKLKINITFGSLDEKKKTVVM